MNSKSYSPEIAINNSGYPVSYVTSTDTIFMPGEHGEQLTNRLDYKKIIATDLTNGFYTISNSDNQGSVDNYIFVTDNTVKVTLPQVTDEKRELHLFFKNSIASSGNIIKTNLRKTLNGTATINDFFSGVYSNIDLNKPILYVGNSSDLTIFINPSANSDYDNLLNRYIINDNSLANRFTFQAESLSGNKIEFCPYKLCEAIQTGFINDFTSLIESTIRHNIIVNATIIKDDTHISTLNYNYYSNTLVIDDNTSMIETANGNNDTGNQLIVRLAEDSNFTYKVNFEILYERD